MSINTYKATVLADNPLGYWRLGEISGNTFIDSISNFPPGLWTNIALNQSGIVPGEGSPSVNLTQGSFGKISTSPFPSGLSGITLEAWVRQSSITGSQLVVGSIDIVGGNTICGILLNSGILSSVATDLSGTHLNARASGFTALVNTNYHIMTSWSGSTMTFMVNGISYNPMYTSVATPSSIVIPNIFIGEWNFGFNQFLGKVSNISIYPTVLSSGSMLAHYNAGITPIIPYNITGPSITIVGSSSIITYTPPATITDVVTPRSSFGTFSPSVLTFINSSGAQTTQFTPSPGSFGNITIDGISTNGITFNSLNMYSYGVAADVLLSKTGKTFVVLTHSTDIMGNNNYAPAYINSVLFDPVFMVNDNVVDTWPAMWEAESLDTPFIQYQVNCGGVESVTVHNGGLVSYTSPIVTASKGGGTGLVLDKPVLFSGILSYVILNPGNGYLSSFSVPIPGGSFSQQAWAWVHVVSGVVSNVWPLTGGPISYGIGYHGPDVVATLNGSQAWANIPWTDGNLWAPAGIQGVGLQVSGIIGSYIQSVPVISGGVGYTSRPDLTVTDLTGSGAFLTALMTGPTANDKITYTIPDKAITSKVLSKVGAIQGVTNGVVKNWKGKMEGPTGRFIGFTTPNTLGVGGNMGYLSTVGIFSQTFEGKNKLKCNTGFVNALGANSITLDNDFYPSFWTPNSLICAQFIFPTNGPNVSNTPFQGTFAVQYNDDYYLGKSNNPSYVALSDFIPFLPSSSQIVYSGIPMPNSFTALPMAGTPVLAGGTISSIPIIDGGSGIQAANVYINGGGGWLAAYVPIISGGKVQSLLKINGGQNYTSVPQIKIVPCSVSGCVVTFQESFITTSNNNNAYLSLFLVLGSNSDGVQHVHNPWVFAPNNTIDRSKPYAMDDNVVRSLTASDGSGPAVMRWMQSLSNPITTDLVDRGDRLPPTNFSWNPIWLNGGNGFNAPLNSPVFSGIFTPGSKIVTNVNLPTDGTIFTSGTKIFGSGLPGLLYYPSIPNTSIVAISGTQITLSNASPLSGYQMMSKNPYPGGNLTAYWARFYNTNPSSSIYSWNSPHIYTSESWASGNSDGFGRYINLINNPSHADDNGKFLRDQANSAWGIVELRFLEPHGIKSSFYGGRGNYNNTIVANTNGTTVLTGSFRSNVASGQLITGAGIPSATYLVSTSPTGLVMSRSATASGSNITLALQNMIPWNLAGTGTLILNGGPVWVTGPLTIMTLAQTSGPGNINQNDFVSSNIELPIFLPISFQAPQQCLPIEFIAAASNNWPNTIPWINLPWCCSPEFLATYAKAVSDNTDSTKDIFLEIGNEHWNIFAPSETQWEIHTGALIRYLPSGTRIYRHYTPSGTVEDYITDGVTGITNPDAIFALKSANRHYEFTKPFADLGNDPKRVKLIYGSHLGSTSANIISAVLAYNLPQDYITTDAYEAAYGGLLYSSGALPAGYRGVNGRQAMPIDAIIDYNRYRLFFNKGHWDQTTLQAAQLSGTKLRQVVYEGAISQVGNGNVPFYDQFQQDILYHPEYYSMQWCYYKQLEQGNFNIPNAGYDFIAYFNYYGFYTTQAVWELATGAAMSSGYGSHNQFVFPQGGSPGTGNPYGYFQTNVSPGLEAAVDYNANTKTNKPILCSANINLTNNGDFNLVGEVSAIQSLTIVIQINDIKAFLNSGKSTITFTV